MGRLVWLGFALLVGVTVASLCTANITADHVLDVCGIVPCLVLFAAAFRHSRLQKRELERRVDERTAELQRSQEQLLQAQKMDAIGRLAGGVAHDFNNLLTVILGGVELLAETSDDETLLDIKTAGERAAGLTRQLLAFSRQQVLAPKVIHIGEAIAGMDKLLRRALGEQVTFSTSVTAGTQPFRADPGQLGQVLLNLAVNARDAMPKGGTLQISAETIAILSPSPLLPAGVYTRVSVADTGTGMDEATRARIFEPFFTTKGPGKGTGLGLATVFGIIRQSGGAIEVTSELGAGTTFHIYFPVTEAKQTQQIKPIRIAAPRGTESILLVEDEEGVRSLVRRALVRAGYHVLEAADGEEALRVARAHAGTIDLLLSDVMMPRMSGGELLARVTPERPTMKVLFMSGYTDDMIDHCGIDRDFAFIPKPVTSDQLMHKVRDVLDHSRGRTQ
ncbi:MAG TPA: ATP-binding protein [Kofleriaceae bacterium]